MIKIITKLEDQQKVVDRVKQHYPVLSDTFTPTPKSHWLINTERPYEIKFVVLMDNGNYAAYGLNLYAAGTNIVKLLKGIKKEKQ